MKLFTTCFNSYPSIVINYYGLSIQVTSVATCYVDPGTCDLKHLWHSFYRGELKGLYMVGRISSCSCLVALPGPAWFLLTKIYKPYCIVHLCDLGCDVDTVSNFATC